MSGFPRNIGKALVVLSGCMLLSACVSDPGQRPRSLSEQLTGHTVVFDAPEGLPAERATYNADGTVSRLFRPLLVQDKLSEATGYWWIENGRYCSSGNPRSETEVSSCYTVTISGDRIRFTPWSKPRLIEVFPDLRRESQGRIVS